MCAQQWCKGVEKTVGASVDEGGRERKRRERRVLLSLAEGDRRGYVNGAAGEGAEGIGACLCAEWLRPCEPASLPLLRSLHFPKASQKNKNTKK